MPNFKIFIVFISLVVFPIEQTLGQSKADSLLDLLKSSRKQEKITVLHQLTRYFISSNGTLALEYANDAIALAEELNMPKEKATAMKNRGNVYFYMGSYRLAEESYLESIEIFELTGNLDGAAKVYNNMGVINSRLGNYEKSLQYYQRSMNIKETLGDKQGIAATANNIGEI
ncbi:MAG: tetratricopeptide repeat protein, partial [Bacteroidota bacterium]|nr:tetratricopeptide repeat protein [Bacteroidota bacterium]